MKKYFTYFKLNFITNLQYRSAAIAGICTQIFFGFIFIMVYLAFYESNSNTAPMQLKEIISYLWLNQMFFSLVYFWFKDTELLNNIRNGSIAYELCRPQNMYFKYFVRFFSKKTANVLLRLFPMIIVALLLPEPYKLSLPPNFETFILFLLILFVSIFLSVSISMIIHIIVFWTIDSKGILILFMTIAEIFAGGTVPLPFFPNILRKIAEILPFSYALDFPFRFYSGSIPINQFVSNFLMEIGWTIICIVTGYLLLKRALKKVVIQGG